jgi:hypothetical protein
LSAGVALIGSYAPRASYCDPKTKPCTPVEVDANADRPINIDVRYLPGFGLQRTAASVLATILFGGGLLVIAKAEEEQEEIEPELQLEKQIKVKRLELEANTELVNLESLAQTRVEVHEQELKELVAEMFFERNPEAIALYLPKAEAVVSPTETEKPLVIERVSDPWIEPEPELFFGVELPESPALGVEFWDWEWFNTKSDDLPHIRIIAPTNGGKTTLCDWLVDVVPADERLVITVKRKPHQWAGLEVYGVPEDYSTIRNKLEYLQQERIERTRLMAEGKYRGRLSAIVDEWKAIARNVKAIRDPETKLITNPSAKEIMGEQLTLSRESLIRIFALAQGRQVITWGLEGESDILECFATLYLGSFAVEEAEAKQRKYTKDSEEFTTWGKVIEFLRSLGKRACWVECEFGKFPAIAPDLSKWGREIQSRGEKVNSIPGKSGIDVQQEFEASDTEDAQYPTPNVQHPMPNTQSHNADISPEEMLKQNLDRLVAGFEQSLVQSVNSKNAILRVSRPEVEELKERDETPELEPTTPALAPETAPTTSEKRYTPKQLTKTDLIAVVSKMQSEEVSQTKIVEQLWEVQKSRSGWSKAYREFRNLAITP